MPLVSGGLTAGVVWLLAPGETAPPALGAGPIPAPPWSSERVLERRRRKRREARRGEWISRAGQKTLIALGAALLAELLDPVWAVRLVILGLPTMAWKRLLRDEQERHELPGLALALADDLDQGMTVAETLDRHLATSKGSTGSFIEAAIQGRQMGFPDAVAFERAERRLSSLEGRMLARVLGHPLANREGRSSALRQLSDLCRQRTALTRRARKLESVLALSATWMVVVGSWMWPRAWSGLAVIVGVVVSVWKKGGPDA